MSSRAPKPAIVFRADGSHAIGLGHLVRAGALADTCRAGLRCYLLHRGLPSGMREMLADPFDGTAAVPADVPPGLAEAEYLADYAGDLATATQRAAVVLDGYAFGYDYQARLADRGLGVGSVDDVYRERFASEVVINHAPGIAHAYAGLVPRGRLLSGLRYSILRSAFLRRAREGGVPAHSRRCRTFVCFGGADMYDLTLPYAEALLGADPAREVTAVIGAAARSLPAVRALADREPRLRVVDSVGPEQLLRLLAESSSAVVPASTVLYEVTAARVPVVSGYFVDNQRAIYDGFLEDGLVRGLGDLRLGAAGAPRAVAAVERDRLTIAALQAAQLTGNSGELLREAITTLTRARTDPD